jgi:hypothetical protein
VIDFHFEDPSGIILNMNLLERRMVIKGGRGSSGPFGFPQN